MRKALRGRPWSFFANSPLLNPHEEALAHAYDG
ncbi:hypothetical protein TNMX_03460 [Thermus sp. NMX2.A1]|nr:hypothetical protein TNMX_03460 [Thermus sp. NMX2.A1]